MISTEHDSSNKENAADALMDNDIDVNVNDKAGVTSKREREEEEEKENDSESRAAVAGTAAASTPPPPQQQQQQQQQQLPAIEVTNCTYLEPMGAAAFDSPMTFRFTVALHNYPLEQDEAKKMRHPLPAPFDVVFKWANVTGNGQGDMILDELEVGPLAPAAVSTTSSAASSSSTTEQVVFDLECDGLDLEDPDAPLTVPEDDLLGNGCIEISLQYKGQEFARCMWAVSVGWRDPLHETEMPDKIEASLLTREIVTQRRRGSKASCAILNKAVDWS